MKFRAAFLALALAGVATAATAADEKRNDPKPGGATAGITATAKPNMNPAAAVLANVGDARVGLLYDFEDGITRSKGVTSVRKPGGATGLYCVRTTIRNTLIRRLVPSVTVDYSGSAGEVLLAYYRSAASGCRSNEIGIQTKRLVGGKFLDSDAVGWALVVD